MVAAIGCNIQCLEISDCRALDDMIFLSSSKMFFIYLYCLDELLHPSSSSFLPVWVGI